MFGDEGINQYDPDISLPTLKLTGTVKVHGANAGITYNVTKGKVYHQSRENVIEGGGLYDFANYYENNKTFFIDLLKSYLPITGNIDMITLFGEWAGKGIQKGVAVSKLEKTFFLFGIKVKNTNDDTYWLDISNIEHRGDINFYNLSKIKRYDIEFDFNNPDKHLEVITELTNEVETQCPVGTFFGIDGIGEGIVWETYHNNKKYRFKSKGDKHKVSKSKTVSIEPEKQESIDAFFKYAVTENRLQQGLQKIFFDHDKPLDVKGTGDFVKWVTSDILKEESDTMTASNLEWNDIKSVISKYCAKWFMGKVYE